MWMFLHKLASPKYFYDLSGRFIPWLFGLFLVTLIYGLYQGLWVAPPDYQQG